MERIHSFVVIGIKKILIEALNRKRDGTKGHKIDIEHAKQKRTTNCTYYLTFNKIEPTCKSKKTGDQQTKCLKGTFHNHSKTFPTLETSSISLFLMHQSTHKGATLHKLLGLFRTSLLFHPNIPLKTLELPDKSQVEKITNSTNQRDKELRKLLSSINCEGKSGRESDRGGIRFYFSFSKKLHILYWDLRGMHGLDKMKVIKYFVFRKLN